MSKAESVKDPDEGKVESAAVAAGAQLLQGMFNRMAERKRAKRKAMSQAKMAEGKAKGSASDAQQAGLGGLIKNWIK